MKSDQQDNISHLQMVMLFPPERTSGSRWDFGKTDGVCDL